MHTNTLAPPSGYISAINVICRIFVTNISRFFLHHYILFYLAQLLSMNRQIRHVHRAFKLPLCILSGKLLTFPMVKSKTIYSIKCSLRKNSP